MNDQKWRYKFFVCKQHAAVQFVNLLTLGFLLLAAVL
jgi:hypothetical protein